MSQKYPDLCIECGADRWPTGDRAIQHLIESECLCFACSFWKLASTKKHEVVINHRTYTIGSEPADPERYYRKQNLGMGGRKFVIQFFDGREVVTHNLWHGDEIPEKFWCQIPDTAKFLGNAGFVQVGDTGTFNSST